MEGHRTEGGQRRRVSLGGVTGWGAGGQLEASESHECRLRDHYSCD